jgi:3-hydroxybutyryl-CoA dehydratase
MSEFYVAVGAKAVFSKTVGEADVYQFAGITGDLSPNHVNEAYMRQSAYGRRIAHGALLVGFMSNTSTQVIAESVARGGSETPVSLGYDRIRFLAPVFIGDTVTVTYEIKEIDLDRRRSRADIVVTNQGGETVAVAQHILKWVAKERPVPGGKGAS